jgi:hypothetical protein
LTGAADVEEVNTFETERSNDGHLGVDDIDAILGRPSGRDCAEERAFGSPLVTDS